ncbi:HIT family protein [Actinoplanes bogorensis]|uniref:HIT family protein n=1 Tax=Paractinoplanes bogorensis TaxID=1610840 RepID=A0ABS5Z4F6_9ACTN|nr:HIT family protein [Actinoplanes bogorensis]MBU2670571.1 HIT family protein [Actinoplanes bogorensis]
MDGALERMRLAAALWSVDGAQNGPEIIDAACELLASGYDGVNLAVLAGVMRQHAADEVPEFLEAALHDVGLDLYPPDAHEAQAIAVGHLAARTVAGEMSPEEFVEWALTGAEDFAEPLLALGSDYVNSARPRREIDAEVLVEARRLAFDFEQYARRVADGPCFVCATVAGHPDYRHHVVFEDDETIAFLNREPTLLGYTLVGPKRHLESWVDDLDQAAFERFQGTVHRVARAIAGTLPTERMYSMSFGSRLGNSHLHWHLAPLPPGVPYERQQFHAVMAENGVLDVSDESQAELAREIRSRM